MASSCSLEMAHLFFVQHEGKPSAANIVSECYFHGLEGLDACTKGIQTRQIGHPADACSDHIIANSQCCCVSLCQQSIPSCCSSQMSKSHSGQNGSSVLTKHSQAIARTFSMYRDAGCITMLCLVTFKWDMHAYRQIFDRLSSLQACKQLMKDSSC